MQTIDASEVQGAVKLTGNKLQNLIIGSTDDDYIDGGAAKDTILGGDGNDTILGGKGNDSLQGGAGSDVFIYASGDGNDIIQDYKSDEDMIQIKGVSSITYTEGTSDMVIQVGSGKITLKKMAGKKVAYKIGNGSEQYINGGDDSVVKGTTATLTDNNCGATFDARTYQTQIKNINASARTADINIIGNAQANSITGGAGNDTLWGGSGNDSLRGGAGSDVFVYNSGEGNDVIVDYHEREDKINFKNDTATISTNGKKVIFTFDSGKITVNNSVEQIIKYVDKTGEHTYLKTVDLSGTTALLAEGYAGTSFNAADHSSAIKMIDAGAVKHGLTITANAKANDIIGTAYNDSINGGAGKDTIEGGAGDDTIVGGTGDDELYGGEGADLFVYKNGDGKDIIHDYKNVDTIQITSGSVSSVRSGSDVVLTIGGDGKLTVEGGTSKNIQLIDANNKKITPTATASASYWFTADDNIFSSSLISLITKETSASWSIGKSIELSPAAKTFSGENLLISSFNASPLLSSGGKR